MPLSEIHRKRRGRNLAVAGALVVAAILLFLTSFASFQAGS
ncbi:MAG: hypothetical protein QF578_14645 [Alphaproteobacteria bacterium]|jgi:hypothetical protein|nr:hypothetical protein [Alphaproteobacteria bacterium]MDP6566062.1 hypothetical protein [Alphaproteobacteria bacterium]MDP6812888.1 hypothetical protein [Alphaproteobacteria bacterium]